MRRLALAVATLLALPTLAIGQSAPTSAPAAAVPAVAAPAAPLGGRIDSPEAKARFEKFRAACGADLQTHCATVQRGVDGARGELRQCIDTNKARFSVACQAAVAERDAARDARRQTGAAPASVQKPNG